MEKKRDGRREVVMTDLEALVPQDHLLRKIEKIMDYDWLYERLSPYYCEDNGRPGIDPVVLIMALLEHLYGIRSLLVSIQNILHPCYKFRTWFGDAPFLLLPRLKFVFSVRPSLQCRKYSPRPPDVPVRPQSAAMSTVPSPLALTSRRRL